MLEQRNFNVEFRFDSDTNQLVGKAIAFETESRDLGGFVETISKDALRNADMSDIVLLFNHNQDAVLARYKENQRTLDYTIGPDGVNITATLPDTQLGKDIAVLIQRGDIDQMSFAFRVSKNGDEWEKREDKYFRIINSIDKIADFSVVTRAAYSDTTLAMRSLDSFKQLKKENTDVRMTEIEAQRQSGLLQRQLQILRMRNSH